MNKAERRQYDKRYRADHREQRRENKRRWDSENPGRVKEHRRKYNASEHKRVMQRQYREVYMANGSNRVVANLRGRVWELLSREAKSASTTQLIGCASDVLKKHLEEMFKPGMTWANYGSTWHVDHVRPLAWYGNRFHDPTAQREAFNWQNLQPMFGWENRSKGARYEGEYRKDREVRRMMNAREKAQFDKIPAKYRDRVDEVEYEPENKLPDGFGRWWVYAANGWRFPDGTAPHTIHEDNWAECMKQLRASVVL